MRHLMSPLDFTVEELDEILDLADDIEANPEKYAHACDGKMCIRDRCNILSIPFCQRCDHKYNKKWNH